MPEPQSNAPCVFADKLDLSGTEPANIAASGYA
jgi:hypothetical protein